MFASPRRHQPSLPFAYRQGGDQVVTAALPRRVDLRPGDQAFVTINKCRRDLGDLASMRMVQVTLPSEATPLQAMLPTTAISVTYCGPADPASSVSVSAVAATLRDTLAR